MSSQQMPNTFFSQSGFSPKATLCGLVLLILSGCAASQLPVAQPQVASGYRSELADPQAKALFTYGEYRLLAADNRWDEAIAALKRSAAFDPDSDYLQMNLAKALLHKDDTKQATELLKKLLSRSPQNSEAQELLGDLLSYQGEHEAAIEHYRKALALKPDDEMLQMRLAMALSRQGQYEKAIQVLQSLVAKHPDAKLARLALARSYAENHQTELAKQTYRQLLEQSPDLQQAIIEYGKLLESEQLYAEAYQLYRQAVKRNPRLAAVRQQLAMLYLKQRRIHEALEQFQAIRQQFPDHLEILGKIGLIHLELEDWTQAETDFRQMLKQAPDDDRNRYYLGMALIGQGKRKEAIEVMSPIRDTSPIFSAAVLQLAYLYQQTGQTEQAITALRKLLDMDIQQPEIYYYLASFLGDAEKLEEAGKVLATGLEHFPADINLLYQQGIVYEKLGDRDKAVAAMQQVLQLKPDHPDALNYIAYDQAERGEQLDLALSRAQKALSIKKAGYIIDTLGWIYFKMGRYQESRKKLEEAVGMYPQDPVILEHLGDLYRAMKLWQKAAATYRKILQLDPQTKGVQEKLNGLPKEATP